MTEVQVISLVEFQSRYLVPSQLSDTDAHRIYVKFGGKVAVEWPTPKTQNQWKLTSHGWVGYIPLSQSYGISLKPKIPLNNLFGMLEYAYDLNSFQMLEGLYDADSIREFYDRLAIVLAKRILSRVRQGLYREYIQECAANTFIRGRIDIPAFCRNAVNSRIPCHYEDITVDNQENQILAWTLHSIVRSGLLMRQTTLDLIRKANRTLRNTITLKPCTGTDCANREYNRLNANYDVLHKLCHFFLENTGPTQDLGNSSMIPFMVDMAKLFELFVARWLEEHLESQYQVKRQESFAIGENNALRMVTDILIFDRASGMCLCVLDTKYKAHSTVTNDDYYQVVAYADALGCRNGILIYPSDIVQQLNVRPGRIRVRSCVFDLGMNLNVAGERFLKQLYPILIEALDGKAKIYERTLHGLDITQE